MKNQVVMADKKSEGVGLMSLGLQNRLLEVAAIVGMDNDTGLQIRKTPQVTYLSRLYCLLAVFKYFYELLSE